MDDGMWWAGQAQGLIQSVESCGDIVDGIIAQAESILRELPMTIHGKEPQWASAR